MEISNANIRLLISVKCIASHKVTSKNPNMTKITVLHFLSYSKLYKFMPSTEALFLAMS